MLNPIRWVALARRRNRRCFVRGLMKMLEQNCVGDGAAASADNLLPVGRNRVAPDEPGAEDHDLLGGRFRRSQRADRLSPEARNAVLGLDEWDRAAVLRPGESPPADVTD